MFPIPLRFVLRAIPAAAMLASSVPGLSAQQPTPVPPASRDTTAERVMRSAADRPLLDFPVQRDEYRVGPGDVLGVGIFGAVNRQIPAEVTPEGVLLLPSIGVVRVQGLTVEEAEQAIRRAVMQQLRNVDVFVTVLEVRRFNVFVLGDVESPGVRAASAVTRASEVLGDLGDGIARRQIVLRRASGDSTTVDLARFALLGDLAANPLLREGDVLLVPALDETVQVHGHVAFPGTYEFRAGESLADLLRLVRGGAGWLSDTGDSIRLGRFIGPRQREVEVIALADAAGAAGERILLRPFDAVYVPGLSNYKDQHFARAEGQVRFPGEYPIEPGVTTISQLVAMAGGLTDDASLTRATLRRIPLARASQADSELQRMPPELLSEQEQRILEIESRGDASNVVMDLEALLLHGQSILDQRLQDGDVLTVPLLRNDVIVLGAVRQPGVVQYGEAQRPRDYVRLAGGFSDLADRGDMVVLKGKLGTRLSADEVASLDPGDTVVVPFKERRTFLQRVQDISAIIGPISTLILTIIALDGVL